MISLLKKSLKNNDIKNVSLMIENLNEHYCDTNFFKKDEKSKSLIIKDIQKAYFCLLEGAIEHNNIQYFKLAQRLNTFAINRDSRELFNDVMNQISNHKAFDLVAPTILSGLLSMSEITQFVIDKQDIDLAQYVINSPMLDFDMLSFNISYGTLFSLPQTDELIDLLAQNVFCNDFAIEQAFNHALNYQDSSRIEFLIKQYPLALEAKLNDWNIYIQANNQKDEFDSHNLVGKIKTNKNHIQIFSYLIELFETRFDNIDMNKCIEYFTLPFRKNEMQALPYSIALVEMLYEGQNKQAPENLLHYLEQPNRLINSNEYQPLTHFSNEYEKLQLEKIMTKETKNTSKIKI